MPAVPRLLSAALALAAACLLLTASASAATKGGGAHRLASDGTPLALRSVALGQTDRDLILAVRFRKRLEPRRLAVGKGRLCATFVQSDREHRPCLERAEGAWRLRVGEEAVRASVSLPTKGSLTVRFRPERVGLAPGVLRWSVAATPATCPGGQNEGSENGGDTPEAGGGADDGGVSPSRVQEPDAGGRDCASRAPRGEGDYAGRVWRVVTSGCQATGAAQVRQGPRGKRVALTYDDGPSPYTTGVLNTLKGLGVPATFFMIGQQVSNAAGLVRRMVAEGHEPANHSWSHANLGGGGPAATSQLARTNAAIRAITGSSPCVFRPPYGSTSANLVSRGRALGMTSVLWSVDPLDWQTPGTGAIVSRVLSGSGPGAIILTHDGGGNRSQTVAATPGIVNGLRGRGYTFVTVSELLGYRRGIELVK